jgi:hypothetical protein
MYPFISLHVLFAYLRFVLRYNVMVFIFASFWTYIDLTFILILFPYAQVPFDPFGPFDPFDPFLSL